MRRYGASFLSFLSGRVTKELELMWVIWMELVGFIPPDEFDQFDLFDASFCLGTCLS